ncbi:MAG: prolipoprotein diacylglyceryl transferase [Oscillospiraceae bacterium]|jgi:prolipoprotein diacylglyceryltransferase|nr:prolipoprotein diacylglyceryl transferase [Oscillospiraceae bacterium]
MWTLQLGSLNDFISKLRWYYAMFVIGAAVALGMLLLLARNARLNQAAISSLAHCAPPRGLRRAEHGWQRISGFFLPDPASGKQLRAPTVVLCWLILCLFVYWLHDKTISMRNTPWEGLNGAFSVLLVALMLTPVLLGIIMMLWMRQSWGVWLDLAGLSVFTILSFGKFGCTIIGCCYGVPSSWGFRHEDTTVFPIQPFEGATYLLGIVLAVVFLCRSRHYLPGRVCSVTSAYFSVTRFAWEFLRAPEKIGDNDGLFGLRTMQLVAVIGTVIAVLWWFVTPKLPQWQGIAEGLIFPKRRKVGKHRKKK